MMRNFNDMSMREAQQRNAESGHETPVNAESINIVQRGNLKSLEKTLRKQWRLGQNIVLCWCADSRGVLVIFVPHYYLGNFCAIGSADERAEREQYIRSLIAGTRCRTREDILEIAKKLDTSPTFIKLDAPLSSDEPVTRAIETLIKRYGLSYVDSRAVMLIDIAEFSLYTPFEQASQLNSCSYSMNSAYNKLLAQGIEVNFARTTTGDGYYVWNRNLGPYANQDLFFFMLLVLADNAVARQVSRGNTVPVLRSAYHIGSHYELFQAEGINPTVFSYIVGDVTIELARMLAYAKPHQVLVGDFSAPLPSTGPNDEDEVAVLEPPTFIKNCAGELEELQGVQLASKGFHIRSCRLTGLKDDGSTDQTPEKISITDKHGLLHHAYNLRVNVALDDDSLSLGLLDDS